MSGVEDALLLVLLVLTAGVIALQLKALGVLPLVRDTGNRVAQVGNQMLQLETGLGALEKAQEKIDQSVRQEISRNREEANAAAKQAREELALSLKSFGDLISARVVEVANLQQQQLDAFSRQIGGLTQTNEHKLEAVRATVEEKLRQMQEDNTRKLEEMRATVDEKLHQTLEQRLSDSFKLVSERLEQVYKGLGEMQNLAVGVGDLKKVLANVKTRGVFGEIQLGNILEEILTPDQYYRNVATRKDSNEVVEYAIKLPGPDGGGPVLLPVDAKFPQEDYLRLLDAYEAGDAAAIEQTAKALESRIKVQAKAISSKYISVPETTDFGIMFLPTESLYAEVLRRPGLVESIQKDYRVVVTGPSTLAAFLNSLAVGFRTLAIQKHSNEVWQVLGAVKTEFAKYGDVLDRVHKQLETASNTIQGAQRRTRAIERKLRAVEELPAEQAVAVLGDMGETDGVA